MMSRSRYPFAVRLIGFSFEEAATIEADFARNRQQGYGYFRLHEDNLQDPDLYLANADDSKALIALSHLGPSNIRPVLLVGSPEAGLLHAFLPRPVQWQDLLGALDRLIEKRADTLSVLEASDVVTVPERRRKDRLDLDLNDPSDYVRLRRSPVHGSIVIVDKNAIFSEYVAELLTRRKMPVDWAINEEAAIDLCRQKKISIVMINTSTPNVDAYRLCEAIKEDVAGNTTVIFLIAPSFSYDQALARRAGCDGFLHKPLTTRRLISALKKFLPPAS